MRCTASAAMLLALCAGSAAMAQTAVMPPHGNNFNGSTRGYFFTAPVDFRITGVQVLQAPGGTNSFQNWAVVRFHNNTPPPAFPGVTNAFDQLDFGLNDAAGSYIPVDIVVNAGDVIGIYGNTATAFGTTSGTNSYTPTTAPPTTEVLGHVINLSRSGMQFHLGSATSPQGMHDIWFEASNAISRVEFTYAPLDPNAVGACCMSDGTCDFITYANCQTAGGSFAGANVPCSQANCPQPGACCMNDGTCTFVLESACASAGGNWTSAGTTCAQANCPQPQACCFFDGTCTMLVPNDCASQGGASQGSGTDCATTVCPGIPGVFYANCNLSTGTTSLSGAAAPPGGEWSEAGHAENDPTTANDVAGFAGSGAFRLADDFAVPAGGLDIAYVKFPVYTTGATTITTTGITLQIWDGPPGDPGSTVVFGDTTTNRLANVEWSDIYRIWNTIVPLTCGGTNPIAPGTTRRIQWAYAAVNQNLPEGTYWLDWGYTGGSFSPGATAMGADNRQCDPNNANALQFNITWGPITDPGYGCLPQPLSQDLYFEILGDSGSACYANCDGSTVPPILNVDDFTCFINEFAIAQTLPHAQQINHYANCDGSTIAPVLNVDDFTCFINEFASGCN